MINNIVEEEDESMNKELGKCMSDFKYWVDNYVILPDRYVFKEECEKISQENEQQQEPIQNIKENKIMEEQKYMTLNDVSKELRKELIKMTSGDIPVRINGKKIISVEPDTVTDGKCHVIECNLNIKMQSNLDRLKEIAEPAPTDWREVAEERRKNREQYHKDLHEWLLEMNKKMNNDIDKEIKL